MRSHGLATAVFLQSRPVVSLEEFHSKLGGVLEAAQLEYEVLQTCVNIQNRLSVNLRFFDKFARIWDDFGIRDKSLTVACAQLIKKFAWYLFIIAKVCILDSHLKREDITEIAFLLYAVLAKVLQHLPREVSCDTTDKLPERTPSSIEAAIKAHLSSILKMPVGSEEVTVVEKQVDALLAKVSAQICAVRATPADLPLQPLCSSTRREE